MQTFFLIAFFTVLIMTFILTDSWFSVARIHVTVWTFLFSGYALFSENRLMYSGIWWLLFSCIAITLGEFAAKKIFRDKKPLLNPYLTETDRYPTTRSQKRYAHDSVYVILLIMIAIGLLGDYINVTYYGFGLGDFLGLSRIKAMSDHITTARYTGMERTSAIVSLTTAVSYAAAICGGFFAVRSKGVWRKIICFAIFIPSLVYVLTTTAKHHIIVSCLLFLVGAIVSYIFTFGKDKTFTSKEIIIFLLSVFGVILLLYFALAWRAGSFNVETTSARFTYYAFGSVEAFDVWLSSLFVKGEYGLGINTFLAPFYAVGLAERQLGVYNYIPGAVSNVFTAFRGLIADFGKYGSLLAVFLGGFAAHVAKEKAKTGKISSAFLYAAILFFSLHAFMVSPYIYVTITAGLILFPVVVIYEKYADKIFAFLRSDETADHGRITGKKIAAGVAISLVVQAISLLANIVINIIVPKFIDKSQYGNWQTFVLYLGYVGLLHFGVLDGIVLRYAQYGYDKLDKKKIRSQFLLLLSILTAIFLIMTGVSVAFTTGVTRNVIIMVGIGVITRNVFTYSSYLCQITNRIRKYAILVITQRVAHALFVVVLLLFKVNDYRWYCVSDLFGDVIAVAISFGFNRELFFGSPEKPKEIFREFVKNISAGVLLLMANWSAAFLLSGAQMVVSWRWLEEIFADVALAFKVTSLVLMFVTAISVVLFPSLKRMEEEKLPLVYKNTRQALSFVMYIALLFYFPGKFILSKWLPYYSESLTYLAILMPIVVYSSKVTLLTNNYMKVYRREGTMFIVNLLTVAVGFGGFLLAAFVFNDLTQLRILIVAAVIVNSIVSEILVLKIIKVKIIYE
ncbi:MAG: oligosaccharide repeat unit polymerase, partial [Clostridia bacterium]|nr:oligosaccharide repeat unit polymerase [Clostridia bacterium]